MQPDFPAMVAAAVPPRERAAIPAATEACWVEWKRLEAVKCWDMSTVEEFASVLRRNAHEQKKIVELLGPDGQVLNIDLPEDYRDRTSNWDIAIQYAAFTT